MPLLNILDSPLGFLVERQAMLHALPMRSAGFSSRGKYFFLPREIFFPPEGMIFLTCGMLSTGLPANLLAYPKNSYKTKCISSAGISETWHGGVTHAPASGYACLAHGRDIQGGYCFCPRSALFFTVVRSRPATHPGRGKT